MHSASTALSLSFSSLNLAFVHPFTPPPQSFSPWLGRNLHHQTNAPEAFDKIHTSLFMKLEEHQEFPKLSLDKWDNKKKIPGKRFFPESCPCIPYEDGEMETEEFQRELKRINKTPNRLKKCEELTKSISTTSSQIKKLHKHHGEKPNFFTSARLFELHARIAVWGNELNMHKEILENNHDTHSISLTTVNPKKGCGNHQIVYVNGINTSYKGALETAQRISDSLDKAKVTLLYNPSSTPPEFIPNISKTLINKFLVTKILKETKKPFFVNSCTLALHTYLMKKFENDQCVFLIGHSEGAMNIEAASSFVPEELRKKYLSIVTIGAPFPLDRKLAHRVINWVNDKDLICQLGKHAERLLTGNPVDLSNRDIANISISKDSDCWHHSMEGPIYKKVLDYIGEDYRA